MKRKVVLREEWSLLVHLHEEKGLPDVCEGPQSFSRDRLALLYGQASGFKPVNFNDEL